MRFLGWILGGIYLLDGVTTLVAGQKTQRWAMKTIGRKLPRKARSLLHLEPVVTRTWGVNNLLAGAGLVLMATLMPRRRVLEF